VFLGASRWPPQIVIRSSAERFLRGAKLFVQITATAAMTGALMTRNPLYARAFPSYLTKGVLLALCSLPILLSISSCDKKESQGPSASAPAPAPAVAAEVKTDGDMVQGQWVREVFEKDGQINQQPESWRAGGLVISGDKFQYTFNDSSQIQNSGIFAYDSQAAPKTIDFTILVPDHPEHKDTRLAIYELRGDRLRIAMYDRYYKQHRPKSFDYDPDISHFDWLQPYNSPPSLVVYTFRRLP
jgi:uncharacterized protein (TIGR03067 family)